MNNMEFNIFDERERRSTESGLVARALEGLKQIRAEFLLAAASAFSSEAQRGYRRAADYVDEAEGAAASAYVSEVLLGEQDVSYQMSLDVSEECLKALCQMDEEYKRDKSFIPLLIVDKRINPPLYESPLIYQFIPQNSQQRNYEPILYPLQGGLLT